MQEIITGITGVTFLSMLGLTFRMYQVAAKSLGSKITREECHVAQQGVRQRIDDLEVNFNHRFDSFDKRIDDVNTRITDIIVILKNGRH